MIRSILTPVHSTTGINVTHKESHELTHCFIGIHIVQNSICGKF